MRKASVFGLLKINGKVYTIVVPNAQSATLLPIIREKVKPNSIRIPFVIMMCLISVNLAIFASITARILLKIITTLTELRILGIKQNVIYANLMVFLKHILSSIERNMNGVLITVM